MAAGRDRHESLGAGLGTVVSVLAALALFALPITAQSGGTSTTLRYGSGLLDVPTATVLPHLTIAATYSGFGLSRHGIRSFDRSSGGRDRGGKGTRWLSDGSVAIGLFDRLEAGATLQHFADAHSGGRLVGGFGRLSLLPGSLERFHLAVGARYVTSPSFGDSGRGGFQPNRLGYPDARVVGEPPGRREFQGNLSPYVVATAGLPGLDGVPFEYDMTLSAGWGGGLFSAGRDLDFHAGASTGGLFAGSALHVTLGAAAGMSVMAEFNGFDANAGVRLDFGGVQVSAFSLGVNHDGSSGFRSRKFGLAASVAVCTGELGLCRRRSDAPADTVTLPAPPPDTVIVERVIEAPGPAGTPTTLCLATGESVRVWVTAAGDTLVGPGRVSLEALGPGVVLAGTYAEGRNWFEDGEAIGLAGRSYRRSGAPGPADCGGIERVGRHDGVPVFADRGADMPFDLLYVPVRPGLWARYENDPGDARDSVLRSPDPSQPMISGVRSSAVSISPSTSSQVTDSPSRSVRFVVSASTDPVLQRIPANRSGCGSCRPTR